MPIEIKVNLSAESKPHVVVVQQGLAPAVPWLVPVFEAVRVCEISQSIPRHTRITHAPVFIDVVDASHALERRADRRPRERLKGGHKIMAPPATITIIMHVESVVTPSVHESPQCVSNHGACFRVGGRLLAAVGRVLEDGKTFLFLFRNCKQGRPL